MFFLLHFWLLMFDLTTVEDNWLHPMKLYSKLLNPMAKKFTGSVSFPRCPRTSRNLIWKSQGDELLWDSSDILGEVWVWALNVLWTFQTFTARLARTGSSSPVLSAQRKRIGPYQVNFLAHSNHDNHDHDWRDYIVFMTTLCLFVPVKILSIGLTSTFLSDIYSLRYLGEKSILLILLHFASWAPLTR